MFGASSTRSGNDMQGAGYTNLLSSSMVAMLGWTFVAADSVSDALLVQKMQLRRVWLRDGFLVLAAICGWDERFEEWLAMGHAHPWPSNLWFFGWSIPLSRNPKISPFSHHSLEIIFFQSFLKHLKHLKPRLCHNRHGVSVDALGQLSRT